MELEQKVESLEQQLKKQSRFLRIMSGLFILTVGLLLIRWILGVNGRLDLQGRTLLVRSSFESNVVFSSAILPYRLDLESRRADAPNSSLFENRSRLGLAKGSFASLVAAPEAQGLWLRGEKSPPSGIADVLLIAGSNTRGLETRDAQQRMRISLTLDGEGPKLLLIGEKGELLFKAP